MAQLARSLSRDIPQLEAATIATAAGGTAADFNIIISQIPDMTHSFLPSALAEGAQAALPVNSLSIRQASFVNGTGAAVAGNATNNCYLAVNQYRAGVLQGVLAYYPMSIATTLGTAVAAANTVVTVTPPSMAGIVPGILLAVNTTDLVYVQSTTATTFTALFGATHGTGDTVTSVLPSLRATEFVPALGVSTTVAGTVTAGSNKVVTPATMFGVHVGDSIVFDPGLAGQETAVVTVVTATTFTVATLANTHTGTFNIKSASTAQPIIKGGDVLTVQRISNNVTGLATPVGMAQVEFVPAFILK